VSAAEQVVFIGLIDFDKVTTYITEKFIFPKLFIHQEAVLRIQHFGLVLQQVWEKWLGLV
jgi:hypothetical protein